MKKKKSALSLRQYNVSRVDRNDGKTTGIALRIDSAPTLFSRSWPRPSDPWLFADLKIMLLGKRFGSNEEVISETEAYFEAKDKSFNKKGIEWLEKRWNQFISLERDYIDE